ncbi:MAG: hypothetical protein GY759_24940 [Chloroflexi bacterium]|nr:hypothetical protein [Chloroflexota bacterium]
MLHTKTLRGHFDGQHICLDEPYDMEADTPVTITILSRVAVAEDDDFWSLLAHVSLERAYSEHEPEYNNQMIST